MTTHKPRHALYLLPNAFTTAALFFGFYAVFQAINGHWQMAAFSILASAILDACDGRVARLTGTTSAFGVEYDSLADMVSFGVAPAVLLFQWSLYGLNKFGFAAAFFYCAATALRLARFNTQANIADRRYFIGIPSPAAAIFLASYVGCADRYDIAIHLSVTLILCLLMAVTMVSKVRFYSFKTLNLRARRPLQVGLLLVFTVALLYVFADDLMALIFLLLASYLLWGYSVALWRLLYRRKPKETG